ncbi:hypothetical protein FHG87_003359 [Trinorchestia longiramus]|nr:hypothetical protein FHG87_003359 [Trinorchestia longiramus]
MGPTPEPDHTGNLSDEEMPQQPPIFLSSSSDEEQDEDPNPDFPPGYMPIGHHIQIQWDSDTEEAEASLAALSVSTPQSQAEDEIDYSSVAGLMQALQTQGPTVVSEPHGLEDVYADEDSNEAPRRSPVHFPATVMTQVAAAAAPVPAFNSEPLAKEQEDAILSAMKGFLLPPSAIPAWAAHVPDDRLSAIIKERVSERPLTPSNFNSRPS